MVRQMEGEGGKGLVCVTGGTGYVASWLIMRLLELGYTVRTTIRADPEHKKDISFLTTLPGAAERLEIFNANLNDPASYIEPLRGCIGVFHVATPVDFENKESIEVVVNRAVDGTIGILKACLTAKTVKRVVYTGSLSAVVYNDSGVETMDESFWSDVDFVREKNPMKMNAESYIISKTLTERAALEFAEKHGLDLVTLVPSFIVGPFICPKFPSSVHISLAMIMGNENDYKYHMNTSFVHVDDVARAHIFLLEHCEAKGRHVCSFATITIEEMAKFLSTRYPEYPVPTPEFVKGIEGYKTAGLSTKKLLDLGFEYKYGLEDMFDGAIQCCKEKGYV